MRLGCSWQRGRPPTEGGRLLSAVGGSCYCGRLLSTVGDPAPTEATIISRCFGAPMGPLRLTTMYNWHHHLCCSEVVVICLVDKSSEVVEAKTKQREVQKV